MPEKTTSFETRNQIRIPLDSNTNTCERLRIARFGGQYHLIAIRNKTYDERDVAEIKIYDIDLNPGSGATWNGDVMDFQVTDINSDGQNEIIAVGSEGKPIIKIYDSDLKLLSQASWQSQDGLYGTAKCLHIFDNKDIAVLSMAEGTKVNEGYIQIRIYDPDLQLKKITRWRYADGKVSKWGHCLELADIDGDGKDELIALVNFDRNGTKRSELRILDDRLFLKSYNLIPESMFATCMSADDIDNDGNTEIIIGGGTFGGRWQGATNQLMVLDNKLNEKIRTTWKTFRHSWLWGIEIADIDQDGRKEIITYGGTSMTGRNQDEANIIGEISIRNGKTLDTRDIFLWQTDPANDTRPSRGVPFKDADGRTCIAVTTSKWSGGQNTNELEIRTFNYKPDPSSLKTFIKFINACNERDSRTLAEFSKPDDKIFAPIALEALALCGDDRSLGLMEAYISSENVSLFHRAIKLLQNFGKRSVEYLRKAGFAIANDWIILSPFDNIDNKGFDAVYPPENEINLDAFYAGKGRIIRWGKVGEDIWDDRRWNIYTDLAYTHFDSFERTGIEYNWNYRNTKAVSYLLTHVYCPQSSEVKIMLGSADGVKVWVNGELKYSNDVTRHPDFDQDIFPAKLSKGDNTILLKIASNNRDTWGSWGFYFRITDNKGKSIDGLEYRQPEASHQHNEMLTQKQLLQMLESDDDHLKLFSASEIASTGDKRGNETLVSLLNSDDKNIQVESALALTFQGDKSGVDKLVELSPEKDPLFQFSAGCALRKMGDSRWERFSINNVKDEDGKPYISMDLDEKDYGFYVCPRYKGDETAHVNVRANLQFHLGENISAKCASIMSFGIREPEYRAMGIGGIALRQACDIISERGHSCTIVSTGIRLVAHRLYCQCGFFDRRDHWRFERQLDRISDNNTDVLVRNYEDADKEHIDRLREQYLSNSVGPNTWSPTTSYTPDMIKVAEYNKKIVGYAVVVLDPFDPVATIGFIHVDEGFSGKNSAMKAMLSGIHRYAISEEKKTMSFLHQSPYMKDILISEGYRLDSSFMRHDWIGMFRVNNLANYLNEISPLLSQRIGKSPLDGWRGCFAIKGQRLKASMIFGGNGIIQVTDSADENADVLLTADDRIITGLVSSNCDVWTTYRQNLLTIRPLFNERIRTLLETMFPILPCRMGGWW